MERQKFNVTSPDHPQDGECHSREISHGLIPVGNIPSDPDYFRHEMRAEI
jgi:hypothetical protein